MNYLDGIRIVVCPSDSVRDLNDSRYIKYDLENNIICYDYSFGQHQDCITDYAMKKGYEFVSRDSVVAMGNVIIMLDGPVNGEYTVIISLPRDLTDGQIEFLNEFVLGLDIPKLHIVSIRRLGENSKQFTDNHKKYFEDFINNIKENKNTR